MIATLTSRGRRGVSPGARRKAQRSVAIAAVVVVAGALAACGSTLTAAGDKVALTMWQQWGGGHEREVLDALIARYEAEHPNVTITETPVTNNAKILAAITGGNPPDAVNLLLAASTLFVLPVAVIFVAGQRYFTAGATQGAVNWQPRPIPRSRTERTKDRGHDRLDALRA